MIFEKIGGARVGKTKFYCKLDLRVDFPFKFVKIHGKILKTFLNILTGVLSLFGTAATAPATLSNDPRVIK